MNQEIDGVAHGGQSSRGPDGDERDGRRARRILSWEHGAGAEPWAEPLDGRRALAGLTEVVRRQLVLRRSAERGDKGMKDAEGRMECRRLARFSCWCPKVIATIKHLPETLADRCIVIGMQRKTASEKCERLRSLDGTELRRKCARFVKDH